MGWRTSAGSGTAVLAEAAKVADLARGAGVDWEKEVGLETAAAADRKRSVDLEALPAVGSEREAGAETAPAAAAEVPALTGPAGSRMSPIGLARAAAAGSARKKADSVRVELEREGGLALREAAG